MRIDLYPCKLGIVLAASTALWLGSATASQLVMSDGGNAAGMLDPLARGQGPAEATEIVETPANLRRQLVSYPNGQAGTVVIDTAQTYLYFVLADGKAIRYGIGVGRAGFAWSGSETVTRKSEWPDWTPPQEMIARQPYLARWMAGGESNPLGARAMYLGATMYRIHGTNLPATIGSHVSSGCIRMLNADVIDLYDRVNVGTKVIVLPYRRPVAAIVPAAAREAFAAQPSQQPRASRIN